MQIAYLCYIRMHGVVNCTLAKRIKVRSKAKCMSRPQNFHILVLPPPAKELLESLGYTP